MPTATEYSLAVQNLHVNAADEELQGGQAETDPMGLPLQYAGNFGVVFQVRCPQTQNTWALKCFTKEVAGLQQRYRAISEHLEQARLPFMVNFDYQETGIRVGERWYPALKMRWVEGDALNQFVASHLEKPKRLQQLLSLWLKLEERLRRAEVTHADLQHGNVLLVPEGQRSHRLMLVDYDGMYVPALANRPSSELGHPAYQHPKRLADEIYSAEVDRFSHLVIYSSIRALIEEGKQLWEPFHTGDNLLFKKEDFAVPHESELFHRLWGSRAPEVRALAGHLVLATGQALEEVPLLSELVREGKVRPLEKGQESEVERLLANGAQERQPGTPSPLPADASEPNSYPVLDEPVPLTDEVEEPLDAWVVTPTDAISTPSPGPAPTSPAELDFDAVVEIGRRARRACGHLLQRVRTLDVRPLLQWIEHRTGLAPATTVVLFFLGIFAVVLLVKADLRTLFREGNTSKQSPIAEASASPEAAPSIYRMTVDPPSAEVVVSGEGALIEGSGLMRKLTVKKPDGQRKVVVTATSSGYESLTQELHPRPGQEERLALSLKPAVATFSSEKAKKQQEACAQQSGWRLEITNSIGMKLVLIPAGEFLMGSPDSDPDAPQNEKSQHRVRITRPFYLGLYEVTQEEYKQVMGENPSRFTGSRNPVENVSWNDAVEFCGRLSQKEGREYRLPTEAEWEYACRAGSRTRWCFGDEPSPLGDYAWYGANSGDSTQRVGQKKPNAWGLYDTMGNVLELCADWYESDYYANSPAADPTGPTSAWDRVLRGGSWFNDAQDCRSAVRSGCEPAYRTFNVGFRVALVPADADKADAQAGGINDKQTPAAASAGPIAKETPPKPAMVPESPARVVAPGPVITNSIGMKLVLITAGDFWMGSPERERSGLEAGSEKPQHRVWITKPFYLGVYEVTQEEYEQVMGRNPSQFKGSGNPVENVSWNDAVEFCGRLSQKEGREYRLPTEAEWEYACRAGSRTLWCFGDEPSPLGDYAWYDANSGGTTQRVGQKKPNAWGLYDMMGNVFEWCADWYESGYYANSPAADPTGPTSASYRVNRGGGWSDGAQFCRSAFRLRIEPANRFSFMGFRVALVPADADKADAQAGGINDKQTHAAASAGPKAKETLPKPAMVPESPARVVAPGPVITNSIGMKLVLIPAGEFLMGFPESEGSGLDAEKHHRVQITKPFYLGVYEVTQEEYEQVMGRNPSQFKGSRNPVEKVSWNDAVEFCWRLRRSEGREYRLPTEAEWEYACRAGSRTRWCFGDEPSPLGDYAWYGANSGDSTQRVGQKKPNAWGLYDMMGNVLEWCADWYKSDYYANSPAADPTGPTSGSNRVNRGGSWCSGALNCRSALRFRVEPASRYNIMGFRVALVPTEGSK